MTGGNKKGIEVEKRQQTYFFIQSSFCPLFVKRLIFGYLQRGAVVAAVILILVLHFVFDDLHHILISMARSSKYFYDVELLYPSDKFQTLWIFNMFTCS